MRNLPVCSINQVRALDKYAIEKYSIPSIILMENAGLKSAIEIHTYISRENIKYVYIVSGKGNNGGDGFVIARHLINMGYSVEVFCIDKEHISPDSQINLRILIKMGVKIKEVEKFYCAPFSKNTLIIDALLGTGISSDVRSPYYELIETINNESSPVIAVDIPSGLNGDTGLPCGIAVKADITLTFAAIKKGFTKKEANIYTGKIVPIDISIPQRCYEEVLNEKC